MPVAKKKDVFQTKNDLREKESVHVGKSLRCERYARKILRCGLRIWRFVYVSAVTFA
jgi:hypothetical protein